MYAGMPKQKAIHYNNSTTIRDRADEGMVTITKYFLNAENRLHLAYFLLNTIH